ncbi:hypothetical protein [uncultured Oxalicibacterium sp.]|uniref:hypothetical protein n=1 Tax=uncultured Oxalicibacterium sp. TaxID=1168540 RepID=UPI0025FBE29C|nr:hypothetical protein [uncultured Oxalicibacterium sp.]
MHDTRKTLATLLLFATLGFGSLAHAERISTVTMSQAQQDIRARIQYGLEQGLITPDEARRFYQRERNIQTREMRYRYDMDASPRERDDLWRDIDRMRMDVDRKLERGYAAPAGPDRNTMRLDQRQTQLNDRINQSLARGVINRGEAGYLQQRLDHIGRREAQLAASGTLYADERERLHRDLDELQWEIDRLLQGRQPYP